MATAPPASREAPPSAMPESHIVMDSRGVAWIRGANTKVKEIVLDALAYGLTPQRIREEHRHLSLAQIHAALSYYYDHQAALDAEMERDRQEMEALAAQNADSPLRRRLRDHDQRP